MISRPLWATYIVTPEQKSSGILISELFEVRKWVVEKFHGISPGLLHSTHSPSSKPRIQRKGFLWVSKDSAGSGMAIRYVAYEAHRSPGKGEGQSVSQVSYNVKHVKQMSRMSPRNGKYTRSAKVQISS